MKKSIVAALILVICLTFIACSKKTTDPIAEVEKLITSIGNVTLESEAHILAAENAYAELTEEEKTQITNYAELQSARKAYGKLVELQPAQEFAAKLLTACAPGFKKPLALKVNNAWVWQDDILGRYYFTFSLEVTNDYGNSWTAYYGNDTLGFRDFSEQEISSAAYPFTVGIDMYFVEGGIQAMQNGIELDAEYIQNYLLMNYGK